MESLFPTSKGRMEGRKWAHMEEIPFQGAELAAQPSPRVAPKWREDTGVISVIPAPSSVFDTTFFFFFLGFEGVTWRATDGSKSLES